MRPLIRRPAPLVLLVAFAALSGCGGGTTGPAADPIASGYDLVSMDGASLPVPGEIDGDSATIAQGAVLFPNDRTAAWSLSGTRVADGTTVTAQVFLVPRRIAPDSVELSGPVAGSSSLVVLYAGHYSATMLTLAPVAGRTSENIVVLLGGAHRWRFAATQ